MAQSEVAEGGRDSETYGGSRREKVLSLSNLPPVQIAHFYHSWMTAWYESESETAGNLLSFHLSVYEVDQYLSAYMTRFW